MSDYLEADKELQNLTFSHNLNQVANRLRFQAYLDQEWGRMAQEQAPLSLILGNLDCFKAYNDTYGHQAGDECLQQIAEAIVQTVQRPADLVPRYGGEEFVIILPNTNAEDAVLVAEETRSRVKALEIPQTNSQISTYLTVSLGVASIIPSDEYSSALLITAAEQALYQAKAQGRDRVILHEDLLRQTQIVEQSKVVEQEETLALPQSEDHPPAPVSREINCTATKTELLMSYVAYYVSRGKSVISPLSGSLLFNKPVYQYWGYHSSFQDFWKQLQQRHDFRELYIEGDVYSFGQFLGGSCTVGECVRCNLPIPISEGHAYDVPNCTLCDESCLSDKKLTYPESQSFENEVKVTRVVAIGTPPTDPKNLEEWFSLNGFEVTFVSKPEEVTGQSSPLTIDLVLILAEVSEAQGKTWAQELSRHPGFEGVPILALSTDAGYGLPWMERTLGVEDYILSPHSGDRLARYLRQVTKPQLNSETTMLHWFPR
ncbi:MAG TPA: diguanylate cyclase [Leptolyngbyaceae cyanobacterium]